MILEDKVRAIAKEAEGKLHATVGTLKDKVHEAAGALGDALDLTRHSLTGSWLGRAEVVQSCDQIGDGVVFGGMAAVAHQLAAHHMGTQVG